MDYILRIGGDFEKGECKECPLVKKEYGVDVLAYVCYFRTKEGLCPLEEVKKGRWLISSDGYYPYCSECYCRPDKMSHFCPECGADMRGGKE